METRARYPIDREQLVAFCERNPILKLSLFGSVLRDDFDDESDLDMLVDVDPDAHVTLFDMVGMELELSEMLGRKVDLRTPQELSKYFRQRVLDDAEVQYVRRR